MLGKTIKMKNTMKKFYAFLIAAVALAGFAACNSDSTEEPAPAKENVGKMEFTANVDEATKTTLDGVSVKWCDDDVIGVNNQSYSIKEGTNEGTTATFVGGLVEAPYVAVYPLNALNSYNNEYKFINITLEANVAAGTFADGANIAMAVSENTNLAFKNILSVLTFQVAAACETVTISSENPLVGTVNFDYEYNLSGSTEYETSIELTVDGGFEPGVTYYTTIIPGSHKFTVLTDGKPSREAKKAMDLERNTLVDLGTLPVNYRVYVLNDMAWTRVNLHAWAVGGDAITEWQGSDITNNKATINGKEYNYFEISNENKGKKIGLNFNNVTNKDAKDQYDEFKMQTEVTLNGDLYYRLSACGPIAIDPNDVSTFGYKIYLYDQKYSNKAFNIWAWNDNGAFKTTNWPGVEGTQYYLNTLADDKNRRYVAFDIPASLYGKGFDFLINSDGDSFKSGNYNVKNLASDLYVGFWYNADDNYGWWGYETTPTTGRPE